jgi:hypothetical protein
MRTPLENGYRMIRYAFVANENHSHPIKNNKIIYLSFFLYRKESKKKWIPRYPKILLSVFLGIHLLDFFVSFFSGNGVTGRFSFINQ